MVGPVFCAKINSHDETSGRLRMPYVIDDGSNNCSQINSCFGFFWPPAFSIFSTEKKELATG